MEKAGKNMGIAKDDGGEESELLEFEFLKSLVRQA